MESSRKSLYNVVILYGPVAVGKFTVAQELSKLLGYNFFHNHHSSDLVRQLFERGTIHSDNLTEQIRLLALKEIAEAHLNVVTTHTYSASFVSMSGVTDPEFMKKIESIIEGKRGKALFVHLVAEEKEIIKRVSRKSRKKYLKLRDKKIMKELLNKDDWKSKAPVKNNLEINNTKLSPKKVAKIIKEHFEL